ncbi:nucleotide pyrophosphohydrolase [Bombilactobacillus bombi]|uniref:Nucleotide pyrophosphohydrolase n=1 Tax=Bombilactobacillus bombi TaxID=1303590 RepID=A0A417ZE61_9LACO|nr:nucleotide pyrophosphohydrolase [Bombilactobacillus bombi]RHW49558.1 nucleotide pyrophosphohydrolase [Bombilactobacillus bombi]
MNTDVKKVTRELIKFRDNRNWKQFHSLINLSRALGIEASEIEKIFLWKNNDMELRQKDKEHLKLEIADVLIYAFYMCEKLGSNPIDLMEQKIKINKTRNWNFDKEDKE